MIVFDSNMLTPAPRRGRELIRLLDTDLQLLWAAATRRGIALRLPETVVEEVVANYLRAVNDQIAALSSGAQDRRDDARTRLLQLVPDEWTYRPEFARGDDSQLPSIDNAEKLFRGVLASMFGAPLRKPEGADQEGNRREIQRIPPAVNDGNAGSKGSRDTAIWLTVLAAGQVQQQGNTYFLTNDTSGFGDPLMVELRHEAINAGVRGLRHFTTIEAMLDELGHAAVLPEPADLLAASDAVTDRVRAYLQSAQFDLQMRDWHQDSRNMVLPDTFEILPREDDSRACQIGSTTIVAFTRIWRVKRRYRDRAGVEQVATFTVQMTFTAGYEHGVLTEVSVPAVLGMLSQGAVPVSE